MKENTEEEKFLNHRVHGPYTEQLILQPTQHSIHIQIKHLP